MPQLLGILSAFGAAVAWGAGQAVGKRALRGMSVPAYNMVRESVGMAVAVTLLLTTGGIDRLVSLPPSTLTLGAVGSLLGYICWLCLLFVAVKRYALTGVIPYFHLGPAFVIALSLISGQEQVSLPIVLATVAILAGVVLLRGEDRACGWQGPAFGLGGSAVNGAWLVINRTCLNTMRPTDLFALQIGISWLFFVLIGFPSVRQVGARYHAGQALLSGVLCRVVGLLLMYAALAALPAVVVAPLLRTSLVAAGVSGVLLLGERWQRGAVAGSLLVLAGSATLSVLVVSSGE